MRRLEGLALGCRGLLGPERVRQGIGGFSGSVSPQLESRSARSHLVLALTPTSVDRTPPG